jgi:nucleoside-diphosphate-sugar epimerase
VEDRLRGAGREVRVFSRSGGEGRVRGDLATGEGQETAVQGVEAILHCASSPASTRQVDVEATERLLGVASRASRTSCSSPSSA